MTPRLLLIGLALLLAGCEGWPPTHEVIQCYQIQVHPDGWVTCYEWVEGGATMPGIYARASFLPVPVK